MTASSHVFCIFIRAQSISRDVLAQAPLSSFLPQRRAPSFAPNAFATERGTRAHYGHQVGFLQHKLETSNDSWQKTLDVDYEITKMYPIHNCTPSC